MNTINQLSLDAKSVLNIWSDKNKEKLHEYMKIHQWLNADIHKLNICIKENRLIKIALTDKDIFGITDQGSLFITGRGNYGIAENFA